MKKNVLIVDDSNTNIILFQDIIEDIGYNPLIAENGREALIIIENNSIDLILLDIMMPDINGLELLDELKSENVTKNIDVIMISAKTDRANMKLAIEKGALAYYTKPVDVMQIIDKVNELLG